MKTARMMSVGSSILVVLLLFGGQALGDLVTPTAATASSSFGTRTPNYVINSSGMSTPVTTSSTCGTDAAAMWLSAANGVSTAWIAFDLGQSYTVTGFHLWNYNEMAGTSLTTRGAKDTTVYACTTMPTINTAWNASWGTATGDSYQFAAAPSPASPTYAGTDYTFTTPFTTRYIAFRITSNNGGDAYVGLSEIRFTNNVVSDLLWDATPASGSADEGAGTWKNNDGTYNNWWNGSANGNWDNSNTAATATFGAGGTSTNSYTVTLDGGITTKGLTFNTGALYTLAGSDTLTLGTNGITANETATINCPISASSPETLTAAVGKTLTLGGAVSAGTNLLSIGGAGAIKLGASDRISDTTPIAVNSTGSFDLGGYNETVGAVTLTAGTIANGNLYGTSYTVSAGTISANLGNNGTSTLTKTTTGTVILSGANAYTGGTIVQGGTLKLGAAGVLADTGVLTVNTDAAATFDLNGNSETVGAVTLTTGNIIGTGGGTLYGTSYAVSAGAISATLGDNGTSTLTKTTAGTVTLSAANTYTGATTINAGVLGVSTLANGGSNSGIGASTSDAANLVLGGGTLQYSGNDVSIDRNFTLTSGTTSTVSVSTSGKTLTMSGGATGTTGALTKAGAGTLVLSGTNTYSGGTNVTAGTLRIAGASALPGSGAVTVIGGATLETSGTYTPTIGNALTIAGTGVSNAGAFHSTGGSVVLNNVLTVSSDAAIKVDSGSVTVNGTIGGATLTKTGNGTLILNGTSSFSTGTTVSNGVLRITNGDAIAGMPTTYITNPTSAAASSTYSSFTAIKAFNGSGMSGDLCGIHQWISATNAPTGYILVNLGALYSLSMMKVWNGSTSGSYGGLGQVDLYYSTNDTGHDPGTTFDSAHGWNLIGVAGTQTLTAGTDNSTFSDQIALNVSAQWVALKINSSYGSQTSQLNQIRFYTSSANDVAYLNIASGAALELAGTINVAKPINLSGTGALLRNASDANTISGAVTLGANSTIEVAAGSLTVDGAIGGAYNITKTGTGLLKLTATNGYAGTTTISAGLLQATDGTSLPSGQLVLNGGVFQSSGSFTRALATSPSASTVRWTAGGGFDAQGDNLAVKLGNANNTVYWTQYGFVADNQPLILGSASADHMVDFQNPIDLYSGNRTIQVDDNANSPDDFARISYALSNGSLTKTGAGLLELSAANSYTGSTTVNAGTLKVSGSIATSSGVILNDASTLLTGSGAVSKISGSGLVSPGSSPGILTSTQIDPSSGLDFAFEFTASAPDYTHATASLNDVLRITDGTTPFTGSMTSLLNDVNIYFDLANLNNGTYKGAWFTDESSDFIASIQNAAYHYYVFGGGGGTHLFNEVLYYTLDEYKALPGLSGVSIAVSTVSESAIFDGVNTVNGRVTRFTVTGGVGGPSAIPEPAALGLIGLALLALRKRRSR